MKRPKEKCHDNYMDRLFDMGKISTIEEFCAYYSYMKNPKEMRREFDIYFMRDKELPMWEVSYCYVKWLAVQESPCGGVWLLKVKRQDNVNKMWESLLFALIGKDS